jgi:hypothetical protein
MRGRGLDAHSRSKKAAFPVPFLAPGVRNYRAQTRNAEPGDGGRDGVFFFNHNEIAMQRFLLNVLTFSIIFGVAWMPFSISVMHVDDWVLTGRSSEAIYVWGDSQTFQGLDLEMLSRQTGRPVWSLAEHGAGVYDFAAFVDRVPRKAIVLVGFSYPVLLRDRRRDSSRGLSLLGLMQLARCGYPLHEVARIARKNLPGWVPHFSGKSRLYDGDRREEIKEDLPNLRRVLQQPNQYLDAKCRVMETNIERLHDLDCHIILMPFPLAPEFDAIVRALPAHNRIREHRALLQQAGFPFCEALLRIDPENMYDYTHLNATGAREATMAIVRDLSRSTSPNPCSQ